MQDLPQRVFRRIKRKTTIFIVIVFAYNTFGFLLIQPLLSGYINYIDILRAENSSERNTIELIILNEDTGANKNSFKKIRSKEFQLNEKYFEAVIEEDRNSLIYFYWIIDEPGNSLEKDLQAGFDESSKKEIPPDNNQFNNEYSEPVCYLTPAQINLPGSIFTSTTSVRYLQISRGIPTPPPQLI